MGLKSTLGGVAIDADPWLAERIAHSVAQYEDILLPEEQAEVATSMLDLFTHDEHYAELVRAARPRAIEPGPHVARPRESFDVFALPWREKTIYSWICQFGDWTFEILFVQGEAFFGSRAGESLHPLIAVGPAAPLRAFLQRVGVSRPVFAAN